MIKNYCLIFMFLLMGWNHSIAQEAVYENLQTKEFMREWLLCGPFPISSATNTQSNLEDAIDGFVHDYLKEHGGEENIVPTVGLSHTIDGATKISWRHYQSNRRIIDLRRPFGEKEFALAYAYAEVISAATREIMLALGSDDAIKVWLNGELVHEKWIGRAARPDNDLVLVTLKEGTNRLLLKIVNGEFQWGFAARFLRSSEVSFMDVVGQHFGNRMDDLSNNEAAKVGTLFGFLFIAINIAIIIFIVSFIFRLRRK